MRGCGLRTLVKGFFAAAAILATAGPLVAGQSMAKHMPIGSMAASYASAQETLPFP